MGQIDPSALLQIEAFLKINFDGASCKTPERKKKSSFRASEARPGIQIFQAILDSGFRRDDGRKNFCKKLDDLVINLKKRFSVLPANPGSIPGQAPESSPFKCL
jgi:hypothetical protein